VVFALSVVLWPVPELACSVAMLEAAVLSPSSPLKLRLVSSALFARLCPGLNGGGKLTAPVPSFCVGCDGPMWEFPPDVERCVGVVAPVGMLLDESVRPAPRRYRPGEGFTGDDSPIESERSGMEVDSVMVGATVS